MKWNPTTRAGNIVNQYVYDAFGRVISQTQTISNPFKYVGRFGVMDDGNGMLFMRARYYDPAIGRFINKDPIGFDGGDINLYAYVANNPVNFIDPDGLIRPTIPGYWSYLRWRYICNSLKQRIEHAEEVNKDCKELGEKELYKIDPDAYTLLNWCYRWGYLK